MHENCSMKQPNGTNKRNGTTRRGAVAPTSGGRALWFWGLIALALCFSVPAIAACPEGRVSLYMPAPAGSQLDLLYGLLDGPWKERTRDTLTMTHLPGRGGSYAASRLLDDPAEGCSYAAVVLPSLFLLSETKDLMVDAADLAIIGALAAAPNAIWVAADSPHATLGELAAFARQQGETPGGYFGVAGTGSYTDQHLATLAFDRAAGIKSLYIPVLGSAEAVRAVKSGEAHACWGYALSPESMPGMRALGVAGEKRSPALPDVPTFQEVDVDMVSFSQFAVAVLGTTSEETLEELRASLAALVENESLRKEMAVRGFIPLALGAQDLEAFLEGRRRDAEQSLAEYKLIPKQLRRGM